MTFSKPSKASRERDRRETNNWLGDVDTDEHNNRLERKALREERRRLHGYGQETPT